MVESVSRDEADTICLGRYYQTGVKLRKLGGTMNDEVLQYARGYCTVAIAM